MLLGRVASAGYGCRKVPEVGRIAIERDASEVTLASSTDPSAGCRVVTSRRPPCDVCGTPMEPEHAHHRCPACGYLLPCCGW